MTYKQLRLNFSDYSAKQQERDVQNSLLHTIFLMKISGEWGHLLISQGGEDIDFYPDMDLSQVYTALKTKYPNCRPKVIQNKYLEDYMRTKKPKQIARKVNATQLQIPWKESGGR